MERDAREWNERDMFSVDNPTAAPKNEDICDSRRVKTLLSISTHVSDKK